MRRWTLLVIGMVLVSVLVVVLGGCSSSTSTPTPTTTTPKPTTTTTTTTTITTTITTPAPTTTTTTTAIPTPTTTTVAGPPKLTADHATRPATCLLCHKDGIAGAPKVPAPPRTDHSAFTDATCKACHTGP